MLDLLPPLVRPLLAFDTETTGPEPETDRIVELGFILYKPDGTTREWQGFVNPGIPIPHEATYGNPKKGYPGHGISDEMVADAPRFADISANLLRGFTDVDFCGFNVRRFDLPLMRAEFKRAGHIWSYDDANVLDGFRLWQLGQPRTLSDAVEEFLGRSHEGAHRALDDVRATVAVIAAQLERFEKVPRDIKLLTELQWPKDPNALDPEGKIVWKDGAAVMNFGKNWKGMRLDMMRRKDLDWIANTATGCGPVVKQICLEALQGRFPVKEEVNTDV